MHGISKYWESQSIVFLLFTKLSFYFFISQKFEMLCSKIYNWPLFFSVDTNLIQLEPDDVLATNTNATYADNDDDIIFEVKQNLSAIIKFLPCTISHASDVHKKINFPFFRILHDSGWRGRLKRKVIWTVLTTNQIQIQIGCICICIDTEPTPRF